MSRRSRGARPTLLLATAALLGACHRDEKKAAPPEAIHPPLSLKPRDIRAGDRFGVSIWYVQLEKRDTGQAADSSVGRMRYDDEVREAAHGRARAIRRWWSGYDWKTTDIRCVDGRMIPRIDYFSQFDALLPFSPVRIGEEWQVHAPLGPFNLRPEGLHVQVAGSEANCTLARVEEDAKGKAAVIDVRLEVRLADGTELTLAATLGFDLSQRTLKVVRVYDGKRPVFVADRLLHSAGKPRIGDRPPPDYRGQTIVVAFVDEPVGHRLVHEDEDYSFWERDYGTGGMYVPGFFVLAKSASRWLQLLEVGTAGAKFGRSPNEPWLSVGWDYSSLRTRRFVPLPIRSSFVNNPDEIVAKGPSYVLRFNSRLARSTGDPAALTQLQVDKNELAEAVRLAGER